MRSHQHGPYKLATGIASGSTPVHIVCCNRLDTARQVLFKGTGRGRRSRARLSRTSIVPDHISGFGRRRGRPLQVGSVTCSLGASVPEVCRPLQVGSVTCSLGASVPEVCRPLQVGSVTCSLGASVPEVCRPLQVGSVTCSLGASVPEVSRNAAPAARAPRRSPERRGRSRWVCCSRTACSPDRCRSSPSRRWRRRADDLQGCHR